MRTTLILTTLSLSGGIALAQPAKPAKLEPAKLEIGGTLGGHTFSTQTELGVDDLMDEPGPNSAGLLGLRGGYQINRRLAAEAELVWIPTDDDVLGDEVTVWGLRAHARFDLLTGKLRPFVVAGVGMHVLRSSSPQMDNDTDQAYHWGGGARYALSPKLDVRVDLRHLIVPDRTLDGATSDVEVTAGVTYRFGGKTPPPRVAMAPPPPPRPGDRDGDGLLDNVDQCATQAEDKDTFEDTDGCPDLDNDKDGIVDAADKCPMQAETKNAWQDDDGCPDEVIRELTGIGFENDSAKIDGKSGPILDLAFLILKDNPQLNVEISGHTSSEGGVDYNLDLSLRRAQAVKDYLVKRGIAAQRILTVGHGASVPIGDNTTDTGRRKNRRIEFRILRPDELKL
ncbi:MAG TPA: OmpA family protein [Kofleriaceae bacterium]|nr:OmpA family protein [Kofleriaceae bacterium]